MKISALQSALRGDDSPGERVGSDPLVVSVPLELVRTGLLQDTVVVTGSWISDEEGVRFALSDLLRNGNSQSLTSRLGYDSLSCSFRPAEAMEILLDDDSLMFADELVE
jgi:hypothetical protein